MYNTELAKGHLFSNKMSVELYVFCPPMMYWIGGHIHSRNIVAENDSGLRGRDGKLTKQLTQPNTIGDSIGDRAVLRFCTGSRDNSLSLGGPHYRKIPFSRVLAYKP